MMVNTQINAIIDNKLKVNYSYCLLIRIKSTNLTAEIKVEIYCKSEKPLMRVWIIWSFGSADIDNQ